MAERLSYTTQRSGGVRCEAAATKMEALLIRIIVNFTIAPPEGG